VRANDFLASRPKYDGHHLGVTGRSQGGQLSIVAAVLDPRVTCIAPAHPAYSDVTGYLHGRAGGWPHLFREGDRGEGMQAKITTTTYYDTVNFARRLKVPGFYSWGYNDEVCPPTSTFAMYNIIPAPKRLTLTLELGHTIGPEQGEAINRWLVNSLTVGK
jgi:cephalosporin-C deacetylase-like acetyl esterase